MLFSHLTLLAYIALVIGSPTSNTRDYASVTGSLTLEESESVLEFFDRIGDVPSVNGHLGKILPEHASSIEERDISFGPFSHTYNLDGMFQWVFGDDKNNYNISIDTCIHLSDALGVWDFEDGSRKYNATWREIIDDLGIGKSYENSARYQARLSANQVLAQNEGHEYLSTILCGNPGTNPGTRRDLLVRQPGTNSLAGFKFATLLKTTVGIVAGLAAQELSNQFHADGWQLAGGAVGGCIVVFGLDVIAYQQIRGRFNSPETAIAAAWTAFVRFITMLARGAPLVAGPCQQALELVALEGQLAQAADPTLHLVPHGTPLERSQSCPL